MIGVGVSGRYIIHKNGKLIGTTNNMILDGFVSRRVTAPQSGVYWHIYLGTSNTPVTAADVGLGSKVVGSRKSIFSNATVVLSSNGSDGHQDRTNVFQWSIGQLIGTYKEVGVIVNNEASDTTNAGVNMDSRALIRDSNGDAVDLVMTSSDSLTITYTYRNTISKKPISALMVFGGTPTKVTFEFIDQLDASSGGAGQASFPFNSLTGTSYGMFNNETAVIFPSQAIVNNWTGTLIGGTDVDANRTINVAYSGREVTYTYTLGLSQAQMVAGVEYIAHCGAQISRAHEGFHFDPPLTDAVARIITYQIKVIFGQGSAGPTSETLTARVTPAAITETSATADYTTIATALTSPEGGQPNFTYAWTLQSAAGTPALAADDATSRVTTFSATGGVSLDNSVETWRCTITDSEGNTSFDDVVVDITWT